MINCLPGSATHYDPTKLIIDACVAASVRCYFANEFVGNILSSQFQALPEALVGGKIRVRRYLEQLAEEGRLDWMALNGGPFFEMWLLKGPAGIDVKGRRARIYGEGKKRLNWTPLKVIAEATVEMLAMYPDEQVVNRAMFIRGVKDSTQQRLLDAVEKVVGEKFDVKKVDVDKINRNAKIVFERGIKEQIGLAFKGLTISGQFFEEEGNDWGDLVTNEVVGVKEVDVEEAVRRVLEEFGTEGDVVEGMFRVEACEV